VLPMLQLDRWQQDILQFRMTFNSPPVTAEAPTAPPGKKKPITQ
jgi:hypothetical protein